MAEGNSSRNITCLLNAINEAQGAIRGYDTKAEILGILMALVVGFLNFNFLADYKCDVLVKAIIALATISSLTAVGLILTVLFPSSNPAGEVNLGDYVPSDTYFITKTPNDKYDFKKIHLALSQTDWEKELLLELLKVSHIRDRKHTWFIRAVKASSITFLIVVGMVARIGYVCMIK